MWRICKNVRQKKIEFAAGDRKKETRGGGNARFRFISLVPPKVCFSAHVLGVHVCGSAEKDETKLSSAERKRKHIDNYPKTPSERDLLLFVIRSGTVRVYDVALKKTRNTRLNS